LGPSDGADDVIVGAVAWESEPADNFEGAAFVFLPEPSRPLMLAAGLSCLIMLQRVRARRSASRV
jgi:hypothetical protein